MPILIWMIWYHSPCPPLIYRRVWSKSKSDALQSSVLDDYSRGCKPTIILWSKTKANCDRSTRAFDDCHPFTAASLEKGEEAFSITAWGKYGILGFSLEIVVHPTRLEGAESTEQTNCQSYKYTQTGPEWRTTYFGEFFISNKSPFPIAKLGDNLVHLNSVPQSGLDKKKPPWVVIRDFILSSKSFVGRYSRWVLVIMIGVSVAMRERLSLQCNWPDRNVERFISTETKETEKSHCGVFHRILLVEMVYINYGSFRLFICMYIHITRGVEVNFEKKFFWGGLSLPLSPPPLWARGAWAMAVSSRMISNFNIVTVWRNAGLHTYLYYLYSYIFGKGVGVRGYESEEGV